MDGKNAPLPVLQYRDDVVKSRLVRNDDNVVVVVFKKREEARRVTTIVFFFVGCINLARFVLEDNLGEFVRGNQLGLVIFLIWQKEVIYSDRYYF